MHFEREFVAVEETKSEIEFENIERYLCCWVVERKTKRRVVDRRCQAQVCITIETEELRLRRRDASGGGGGGSSSGSSSSVCGFLLIILRRSRIHVVTAADSIAAPTLRTTRLIQA